MTQPKHYKQIKSFIAAHAGKKLPHLIKELKHYDSEMKLLKDDTVSSLIRKCCSYSTMSGQPIVNDQKNGYRLVRSGSKISKDVLSIEEKKLISQARKFNKLKNFNSEKDQLNFIHRLNRTLGTLGINLGN